MERNTGGECSSRPALSTQQHHSGYAVTSRSRSPSRDQPDGTGNSRRQYRERSRSPVRRESRAARNQPASGYDDREDRQSSYSRRRISGWELARERSRGRQPHQSNPNDYWDDRVDYASQSGSRYSSSHYCIDSALKQHGNSSSIPETLSPTPTPPNAHAARFPPPDVERHYSSHRCHHHSHDRSPARSVSQSHHHRARRRSVSPPLWMQPVAAPTPKPVVLPYGARALSRWDFAAFEPLFAHYLTLHAQVRMADLDEEAVRDRWKGFVVRWNGGELEKTWYEPEMFLRVVRIRAIEEARVRAAALEGLGSGADRGGGGGAGVMTPPMTGTSFASEMTGMESDGTGFEEDGDGFDDIEEEEEEDGGGARYQPEPEPTLLLPPPPPVQYPTESSPRHFENGLGLVISQPTTSYTNSIPIQQGEPMITNPSMMGYYTETPLIQNPGAENIWQDSLHFVHQEALTTTTLINNFSAPAEPGSRERQLEKRQLTTDSLREFTSSKDASGGGGGAGGFDDYRRMLADLNRRRTERIVAPVVEERMGGEYQDQDYGGFGF